MKTKSIKRHLKPYSILKSRKTTINHAFASALAPHDPYDEDRIAEALRLLGQNPASDLTCVYCDREAETWDHLVGLVKDSNLYGYGHQVGNLVPCCKHCNSKKGNKDWRQFIKEQIPDPMMRMEVEKRLEHYLRLYAQEINLQHMAEKYPEESRAYQQIKEEIFDLMEQADVLADTLRTTVKT